ncbi:MAG: hypothetical protein JSW34_10490 [Candidatus Zixiibacteriota bacterium]|nr:MAG: hypothetical protein JSW34_10490 [candidate division Zixibacteria bacterium]
MLKTSMRLVAASLAVAALLFGCGLLSIMILINEEIDTTTVPGDLFYYGVDVTDDEDWEEHQDNIEFVNYVAFDLYLNNPGGSDITFNGYIDDAANPVCGTSACAAATTRVLKDITIPAGSTRHITAGQSFQFIENMSVMKTLAREGAFHLYGVSTGGSFVIDSGRVIVAIVISAP